MKEALDELSRAIVLMRTALRESNDTFHQAMLGPALDRIGLIVGNEREDITLRLADQLTDVRSAVRRVRLPDVDPDLEVPTPALKQLRSERGNLVEALDNAIESAAALRLVPDIPEVLSIGVERPIIVEQLARLDARLRVANEAVQDLQAAAVKADQSSGTEVQEKIIKPYVQTLKVELQAARFETNLIGSIDLNVLMRAIEGMHAVAADLREAIAGLSHLISRTVMAASEAVVLATNRAYSGLRTIVSWTRRTISRGGKTIETIRDSQEGSLTQDGFFTGEMFDENTKKTLVSDILNHGDSELLVLGVDEWHVPEWFLETARDFRGSIRVILNERPQEFVRWNSEFQARRAQLHDKLSELVANRKNIGIRFADGAGGVFVLLTDKVAWLQFRRLKDSPERPMLRVVEAGAYKNIRAQFEAVWERAQIWSGKRRL